MFPALTRVDPFPGPRNIISNALSITSTCLKRAGPEASRICGGLVLRDVFDFAHLMVMRDVVD